MGLDATGRIGRIDRPPDAIPTSSSSARVGRTTGPQQERGVFRTTDGGQHWERVLFVDENTGCSGLTMDPNDPRTLVRGHVAGGDAHVGDVQRRPGQRRLRLARRRHDVDAASRATDCRSRRVGKIDVAIAPIRLEPRLRADPDEGPGIGLALGRRRRVVARRQLAARADRTRRLLHPPRRVADQRGRGHGRQQFVLGVDRRRPDLPRDRTGAATPTTSGSTRAIRIGSSSPTTAASSSPRSTARSSCASLLPIGQMYHVAVDNQVPYYVYSNMQDDGTMRGPVTQPELLAGGYVTGGAVGTPPGRLRIGLHHSRPGRSEHRVGDVLRQQGDPLRRAHEGGAIGRPVDDHARLAAERRRSTAVTGPRRSRSIRSITTRVLLRLPGHLQDDQRRPELAA